MRTLLIGSLVVALPFTVVANMQTRFRPEQVLASPVNMAMFVVASVCFTAMGSAFGGRNGTIVSAILSSCVWIAVVAIITDGKETPLLVMHGFVSLMVAGCVLLSALIRKERPTHDPSATVQQLVALKRAMVCERQGGTRRETQRTDVDSQDARE